MRKTSGLFRPVNDRPGITRKVVISESGLSASSANNVPVRKVVINQSSVNKPLTADKNKNSVLVSAGRGRDDPPLEGSLPRGTPNRNGNEKDNENAISDLIAKAALLSKKDKQTLLDVLALNNSITIKAQDSRDLDMWSLGVQTALKDALGGRDGDAYGVMLIKRLLGSSACWRPVETFMANSKLQELRVVERQAIYLLLAKMLVDHAGFVAQKSGAPLSPKLIGSCTVNLPGVFEQNFPGYLAAGLAPMLAKQMQASAR